MSPESPSGAGARVAVTRAPFLETQGLTKRFGSVLAVDGIDFAVATGEVHGLVGANGAGKSTFIRMLAGAVRPDRGSLLIEGRPIAIHDPQEATRLGLGFVHQELNLVRSLDVMRNIALGIPKPSRGGVVSWRALARQVEPVMEQVGLHCRPSTPVHRLSPADQSLVSVARALMRQARFIALDEPTSSLSDQEVERLFGIVRKLVASGIAILYVSHRLDEVLSLCDRTTVFRDGRRVGTLSRGDATRRALMRAIAGREIADEVPATSMTERIEGRPLLEVTGLRRLPAVHEVSLAVHAGEVLGLAGLVGAGRTECMRLVFGADRPDGGTMRFMGRPYAPAGPWEAIARGIGLVPEERRSQGLVLRRSVAFNLELMNLRQARVVPWLPLLDPRKLERQALALTADLGVKTQGVRTPVALLSGGNQQKVVIGKWLAQRPRLLILDEPTRGVDVGAREEIYAMIRRLAADGSAVIVVSSDFEEIERLCDRALVLAAGRVSGELGRGEINRTRLVALSYAHGVGEVRQNRG